MNHAKLETYRIFDASIVPVCTGGLRVPDSGFRAAFAAKSGGHAARQLGRPAAPGRIRRPSEPRGFAAGTEKHVKVPVSVLATALGAVISSPVRLCDDAQHCTGALTTPLPHCGSKEPTKARSNDLPTELLSGHASWLLHHVAWAWRNNRTTSRTVVTSMEAAAAD